MLNQRVSRKYKEICGLWRHMAQNGSDLSLTTDLGVRGSTPLGRANFSKTYETVRIIPEKYPHRITSIPRPSAAPGGGARRVALSFEAGLATRVSHRRKRPRRGPATRARRGSRAASLAAPASRTAVTDAAAPSWSSFGPCRARLCQRAQRRLQWRLRQPGLGAHVRLPAAANPEIGARTIGRLFDGCDNVMPRIGVRRALIRCDKPPRKCGICHEDTPAPA
jgi:hypothetical protein